MKTMRRRLGIQDYETDYDHYEDDGDADDDVNDGEETAIAKNGLCIYRAVVDYILSCNSMQNMPQDKM